ncbi:hypothetical protein QE152_g15468 [Popillia japonica]|uniref:Uncharacterized protein n=1 Tax=Popillia japonica TaxID=7064 RepID=A0AAW1L8X4_POPJA
MKGTVLNTTMSSRYSTTSEVVKGARAGDVCDEGKTVAVPDVTRGKSRLELNYCPLQKIHTYIHTKPVILLSSRWTSTTVFTRLFAVFFEGPTIRTRS